MLAFSASKPSESDCESETSCLSSLKRKVPSNSTSSSQKTKEIFHKVAQDMREDSTSTRRQISSIICRCSEVVTEGNSLICGCCNYSTSQSCATITDPADLELNNSCSTITDPADLELNDPCGPYHVQGRVKLLIEKWGGIRPIAPDIFLRRLLISRGYSAEQFPALMRSPPSLKQLSDYDIEIVTAVRASDLESLKRMHAEGKSLSACNKFSESIVHMACQRSDFKVVDFMIRNGGQISLVDDYGRTPLHDACWRPSPQFDVVTLLLDRNLDLLRMVDVRGANALNYVSQDQWLQWCAYFYHQKEKYWPIQQFKSVPSTQITRLHENFLPTPTSLLPSTPSEPSLLNRGSIEGGNTNPIINETKDANAKL